MKKTSLLLLLVGLATLYGLSRYFPVPDVSPIRIGSEKDTAEPSKNTSANSDDDDNASGFTAGEFVFPYYRNPEDHEPAWIFRGSKGRVIRDESEQILVENPRILHYPASEERSDGEPSSSQEIKRVKISGREGRKNPGNVAFVRKDVLVRTGKGGQLTTRQLYANFETDRLYTRSQHEVKVDRRGLLIEGIGFSGNSRLSRFTLRKNVYMRLSTTQLRSLSSAEKPGASPPDTGQPYFITGSGPLKARLVEETNTHRTWKISIHQDVYLYRVLESGALRQSSDVLHVTLVERTNPSGEKNESDDSSSGNESRLHVSSLEAIGRVNINDPNIHIKSDHVTMNRTEEKDLFHLEGNTQKIQLKERSYRDSANRTSLSTGSPDPSSQITTIRVSGDGRLARQRPAPDAENQSSSQLNGKAVFNGRVYVKRHGTRLQSRYLSVAFTERSTSPETTDGTSPDQIKRPLRIRSLEAEEDVLFLSNDLTSTGDRLKWTPPRRTIKLRSDTKSVLSDLRNRITGEEITINRAEPSLTAKRNVRTTIRTGKTRGFQLLGRTGQTKEGSFRNDSSSGAIDGDPTKWNLNAQRLSFRLHPESGRLRSVNARGEVQISSTRGKGTGDQFVFDRNRSRAVLRGHERKAQLSQNRNRAYADSFQFHLDHRNVVLKGQKRMQIHLKSDRPEGKNTEDEGPLARTDKLQITSGAPFIIHRRSGRIRVLGPAHVLKPGGRMSCNRVNVTFHPPTNEIRSVRANGEVFVGDRRGAAIADLARWDPQTNRLMLRGQPYALVNRNGNTARFEIISIWNDWANLRGQRYKWRTPGRIRGEKD